MFERDCEMLNLKRQAGVDYRFCGSILSLSPNTVAQRFGGYIHWQFGEREKLRRALLQRIKERNNYSIVTGAGYER